MAIVDGGSPLFAYRDSLILGEADLVFLLILQLIELLILVALLKLELLWLYGSSCRKLHHHYRFLFGYEVFLEEELLVVRFIFLQNIVQVNLIILGSCCRSEILLKGGSGDCRIFCPRLVLLLDAIVIDREASLRCVHPSIFVAL